MDEIHRAGAVKALEMTVHSASFFIQTGDIDKPEVYDEISFKLGSTVDLVIAMNAVPSPSYLSQLLRIVDEVCRRKAKLPQPSLLSLMLPIKAACQTGWFSDADKNRLILMAKKVSYGFSNLDRMNIEPTYAHSYISNIISRFYPRMKVEHILTSFDVKAGYGTFVVDFHISQSLFSCYQDLWLLVARMDNMDTSACIATPSNVNFYINRIEVPKRTKSDMGKGPQLPSDVTKMIKYGVNLLEVFGDFDGQYIIAVAFINLISPPDPPQLQDYVRPTSDEVDSDCEVVDATSLVSLNCPISQIRITTPVKGHLCKHPQCFDYDGFMENNSLWPTWECPVCKKSVCNLDIRIDRAFLKILKEVDNTVSGVILSEDGSWIFSTTEKNQTTKTNKDKLSQNKHAPDITGKTTSIEANEAPPNSSPSLHMSSGSESSLTAERPSTVTTPAVSLPQILQDSCLQSKGSHDMLHMPASVQQIRNHLNPVNGLNHTSQNDHTPDTAENTLSIQANEVLPISSPALHNSGGSANSLTAERTYTLCQSTVTTPARSPHVSMDSSSQSQGSHDMVHTSSAKQIRHHLNSVNLPTTQVSYASKNQIQNVHEADTTGITVSIEADEALRNSSSALHNSGGSANSLTAEEPSTLHQSPVTMPAVPLPQVLKDSCLQSQGSDDMVITPPSVQHIKNHANLVNLHTTRPSYGVSNAIQNDHAPDTTGNTISIEADEVLPYSSSALHNSGGSANSLTAEEPSTSHQSTVTMPAVPLPRVLKDSCLQSQGSDDMVITPPSVQQIKNHVNLVNLHTTRPSYGVSNAIQNDHAPDTTGNTISIEANEALPDLSPALHNSGGSANKLYAERSSTLRQSTVTTPAVSPQVLEDSCLQSQGSHDIHKPPSVQQIRHNLNPVNIPTTGPSYGLTNMSHLSPQRQPQQHQTDQATQGHLGPSMTKKVRSTIYTPVELTPCTSASLYPTAMASEHLKRAGEKWQYTARGQPRKGATTNQAQSTTFVSPSATSSQQPFAPTCEQLLKGDVQRHYTSPGHSQVNVGTTTFTPAVCPVPTPLSAPAPAANIRPLSPIGQLMNGIRERQYRPRGRPRKGVATTKQVQSTTLVTPSATSSHSQQPIAPTSEQLMKGDVQQHYTSPGQSQVNVGTTEQTQSTTIFTPAVCPVPTPLSVPVPALAHAANIRPLSPIGHPKPSGYAMPSGIMRGRLTGKEREAAQFHHQVNHFAMNHGHDQH